MTDCPHCAILEEQIRTLRAELDQRDTLPSPRQYIAEDELSRALIDLDACLPTDSQEGP